MRDLNDELTAIQKHLDSARVYGVMGGPRVLFRHELRIIASRVLRLWWRTRGKGDSLEGPQDT